MNSSTAEPQGPIRSLSALIQRQCTLVSLHLCTAISRFARRRRRFNAEAQRVLLLCVSPRSSAVLYPRIAHFWQDFLSRKQDLQAEGLIHSSPGQRPGFIVQLSSGCRPTACFIAKDESRLQRSWGFALMNPGRCPGLV